VQINPQLSGNVKSISSALQSIHRRANASSPLPGDAGEEEIYSKAIFVGLTSRLEIKLQ
jgi:hypothetical protein